MNVRERGTYRSRFANRTSSLEVLDAGRPSTVPEYRTEERNGGSFREKAHEYREKVERFGFSGMKNGVRAEGGEYFRSSQLLLSTLPAHVRTPPAHKFVRPVKIEKWAVVNFSARCDVRGLVRDLVKWGQMKGMAIEQPFDVFEEDFHNTLFSPLVRVEKMLQLLQYELPGVLEFLFCLLPERNYELYGPWKKRNLADFGIVTQCIVPQRVNDQYLTNVLLKINAKLGGLNSILGAEHAPSIPVVSRAPTIIIGMVVSHGSPGQTDIPSIAVVVSSMEWPLISKYRACVRTQSPRVEMIDNLFKKVSDGVDEGIIRNGVIESQFNQVLNIELHQIIEACKFLDENWNPKFLVIVAQKNHHTRFFQLDVPNNVPPGTVIDNKICHPRNYDFYMCAHAGMIGTSRPTHYHVLLDEIGFSADDLQELVYSLSYVVPNLVNKLLPLLQSAMLAWLLLRWGMKFEERSETASSQS
ncbi:hypothetical protein LR48_Vigan66s002800 [Vigna angularis]|uniref:Piwi domain-containing protein n=1 Tax=Phaseolus angularis TaxID=3914 RepID=A0A0L9T3U2_PHAAN|nr:hypothetical protein LR48_Vigan66s002800 [Vigna angularis]